MLIVESMKVMEELLKNSCAPRSGTCALEHVKLKGEVKKKT